MPIVNNFSGNVCCCLILHSLYIWKKTSQELRMLSTVTLYCQVAKIVMNAGLNCQNLSRPNRPLFDPIVLDIFRKLII